MRVLHVAAPEAEGVPGPPGPARLDPPLRAAGHALIIIPSSGGPFMPLARALAARRPDLVHAAASSDAARAGWVIARARRAPLALDLRGATWIAAGPAGVAGAPA